MRRPDRLAGDASGDAVNRSFYYDGRTFTVYDKEQNVWASGGVPPTVDAALDWVFDQTGTVIPLADFLYGDVYARLMGNVQRGVYLGLHEAAGVLCHHLSFEQAAIDWQIWIDAGRDPLPRKLVIAYKTEDEVPQVLGDHPLVGLPGEGAGDGLLIHAPRRREAHRGIPDGGNADGRTGRRAGEEVMKRAVSVLVAATLVAAPCGLLFAQSRSRGSVSHSRGSTSAQGRYGGSASRNVSQTSSGYNVNKTATTQSGATKSVSKDINTQEGSIDRSSTATNAWGQSASRDRTATNEGGYASIEGSASTSTGRYASGEGVAGRNAYGQPAYAGTVNTKYNGNYATAGARNPYGGWTTATAGPYGGRVTTTLPSGYRTSTYYGRSYYTYGGAYYRPYSYGGVHYYYPVPPPYYAYYESPPVGAMMLMVAGVAYLVSKDGSYSKQTTSSEGKIVYQSVPAPTGAKLQVLPVERVLVTVSGTTYYLASNTFYRRVMEGAQEQFIVVTAPAGVVFVAALPADFTVVQLNTMYFQAGGRFYVPFLAADGKEMYVMVDQPPQPPAGAAAPAAATPTPAAAPPAPAVRAVAETLVVPQGTLILMRVAADLTSASASAGDRIRGFLDQDLATNGRLITPHGTPAYGTVSAVDRGRKTLNVTLTDLMIGGRVVAITTQPLSVPGGAIRAQSPQAFTVAAPFNVDITTNVAVR